MWVHYWLKDRFCMSKLIMVKHRFQFRGFAPSWYNFVHWEVRFVSWYWPWNFNDVKMWIYGRSLLEGKSGSIFSKVNLNMFFQGPKKDKWLRVECFDTWVWFKLVDDWSWFIERVWVNYDWGWGKGKFIIEVDLEVGDWFVLGINEKDYECGQFDCGKIWWS